MLRPNPSPLTPNLYAYCLHKLLIKINMFNCILKGYEIVVENVDSIDCGRICVDVDVDLVKVYVDSTGVDVNLNVYCGRICRQRRRSSYRRILSTYMSTVLTLI